MILFAKILMCADAFMWDYYLKDVPPWVPTTYHKLSFLYSSVLDRGFAWGKLTLSKEKEFYFLLILLFLAFLHSPRKENSVGQFPSIHKPRT